jgi:hypothetical protein
MQLRNLTAALLLAFTSAEKFNEVKVCALQYINRHSSDMPR